MYYQNNQYHKHLQVYMYLLVNNMPQNEWILF